MDHGWAVILNTPTPEPFGSNFNLHNDSSGKTWFQMSMFCWVEVFRPVGHDQELDVFVYFEQRRRARKEERTFVRPSDAKQNTRVSTLR